MNTFWVLQNPYGEILPRTMRRTEYEATKANLNWNDPVEWEWYREHGWRCIKVQVTVLGEEE